MNNLDARFKILGVEILGIDLVGRSGIGVLLAIPLIATLASPRRWSRYADRSGAEVAYYQQQTAAYQATGYQQPYQYGAPTRPMDATEQLPDVSPPTLHYPRSSSAAAPAPVRPTEPAAATVVLPAPPTVAPAVAPAAFAPPATAPAAAAPAATAPPASKPGPKPETQKPVAPKPAEAPKVEPPKVEAPKVEAPKPPTIPAEATSLIAPQAPRIAAPKAEPAAPKPQTAPKPAEVPKPQPEPDSDKTVRIDPDTLKPI